MRPPEQEDETEIGDATEARRPPLSAPATDRGAVVVRERMRARLFGRAQAPVSIGRYTVLEPLGAGGFGEVYAAYDDRLDRRVALKILRTGRGDDAASAHEALLQEARALAQLSHPNVVGVFDVAEAEREDGSKEVVIAMELVQGRPLSQWLRQEPRRWREVVAVFLAAGRGLAAAHARGVIHRDFKPANVVLGDDGRPRVLDFGLARRGTMDVAVELTATGDDDSAPILVAQTGDTGRVQGTPVYMSPEQHDGAKLDARTDQYSFCVALWEGLYGRHPFSGATTSDLRAAKLSGPPRPPENTTVPRRIQRLLARGLQPEPASRFATMGELLGELGVDAGRPVRWAVGGAVVLAAAAVGYTIQPEAAVRCDGGARRFEARWDSGHRDGIRGAFEATRLSYARAASDAATASLDEWRGQWVAAHRGACEAHARSEQSAEAFDLQMACLQGQLRTFDAVTEVLMAADREVVAQAHRAVDGLPEVARCADVSALRQRYPLPEEPTARDAIELARSSVAHSLAEADAGHYGRALELADEAAEVASSLTFPPLQAEIGYARANALSFLGQIAEAKAAYEEAAFAAQEVGDDRLLATIAHGLVWTFGNDDSDFAAAARWAGMGRASVRRVGGDPDIEVRLHSAVGSFRMNEGRYDEALREHEAGLSLLRRIHGERSHRIPAFLNNIANVYHTRGDYEEGVARYREAIALGREVLGEEHPQTLVARNNLAGLLHRVGRIDEAEQEARSVLEAELRTLGPDHPEVGTSLVHLALVLQTKGDIAGTEEALERAISILEASYGPQSIHLAVPLMNLAQLEMAGLDGDRARALAQRALAIQTRELGEAHVDRVYVLSTLANASRHDRDLEAAEAYAREALATAEAAGASAHYIAGVAWSTLGSVLSESGRHEEAIVALQRALQIVEASVGREHVEMLITWVTLADALTALGRAAEATEALASVRAAAPGLTGRDPRSILANAAFVEARVLAAAGEGAAARAVASSHLDAMDPLYRARAEAWLAEEPP